MSSYLLCPQSHVKDKDNKVTPADCLPEFYHVHGDNDYVIDSATSASDEQSQTLVVPGENRTKGEESSYEKVNTH